MDSDKGIGIGIIIAVLMMAVLFFGPFIAELMNTEFLWPFQNAVNTVVGIAFLLILGIGAWIGWTMASTPAPEEIDDEEFEDFDLEEEEDVEVEDEADEETAEDEEE